MSLSGLHAALHCIEGPTVVTVGTFDGVHLGHQYLLNQLKALGQSRGLKTCVITFDKSPREILRPESAIERLSTLDEKVALLYEQDIDYVVPLTFTHELASVSAKDFAQALLGRLNMRILVMGHSNRLGLRGEGSAAFMTSIGNELGFRVVRAEAFELDQSVNSTAIRRALQAGDLALANRLLGRPYSLQGCMVRDAGERLELLVPIDRVVPGGVPFMADIIAERTRFRVEAKSQSAPAGSSFQTLYLTDSPLEASTLLLPVTIQLHG